MARIRSIHPAIFTDDQFVELSANARLLLMGVWTECDDFGLFEWKPKRLKMRIFPADSIDCDQLISELVENQFVTSYEVDGVKYGAVKNFCKWQKPKKPNNFCPMTQEIYRFVKGELRTGGELVGNWWGKSISEGRKEGREEGKKEGVLKSSSKDGDAVASDDEKWIHEKGLEYFIAFSKRPKAELQTIIRGWLDFYDPVQIRKHIQTAQVGARADPVSYVQQILKNERSKNGLGHISSKAEKLKDTDHDPFWDEEE